MSENQFFERKGPFPLGEIIKVIGCSGNFSKESNFKIRSFESLDNASNNDMTFLNSRKYQDLSLKTKAAACITTTNFSKFLPQLQNRSTFGANWPNSGKNWSKPDQQLVKV